MNSRKFKYVDILKKYKNKYGNENGMKITTIYKIMKEKYNFNKSRDLIKQDFINILKNPNTLFIKTKPHNPFLLLASHKGNTKRVISIGLNEYFACYNPFK